MREFCLACGTPGRHDGPCPQTGNQPPYGPFEKLRGASLETAMRLREKPGSRAAKRRQKAAAKDALRKATEVWRR